VRTLEELDQEMIRIDHAGRESDDAMRRVMASFRFDPGVEMPADPHSAAYAEAQRRLYEMVSGRQTYTAGENEQTDIDLAWQVDVPFPYSTRSSVTVGEHLMAWGFLIRVLQLRTGDRLLEFGPGYGNTTLQFQQMGFDVTAVDVNPRFLELIRQRSIRLGRTLATVCTDMLDYQPPHPFDRVVFFECFHHCANHEQMIANLEQLVAKGGMVVFAGEPITDTFPLPWGLRLDGQSVWSIRKCGWLELGFRTDYFRDLLFRHGWTAEIHDSRDVPWMRAIVARRRGE
jgi:2-polyprenyl-3-methyl-5-hydroxy-6-metoxy-1,4-benzoquinol methylase